MRYASSRAISSRSRRSPPNSVRLTGRRKPRSLLRQTLDLGVRNERQRAVLEHNLAIALKQQKKFGDALVLLDAARAKAPDLPALDYNRGNTLQQLGRLEEAVESYRSAIQRNPLDMAAHEEMNALLYRLGDDAGFLRSYDDTAVLYPEVGQLPLHKGNFLYLRGEFEQARDAFDRARSLLPDSVTPHDGMALASARLGHFDQAIAEHEIALRMEPEKCAWLAQLRPDAARGGRREKGTLCGRACGRDRAGKPDGARDLGPCVARAGRFARSGHERCRNAGARVRGGTAGRLCLDGGFQRRN